MRHLVSHRLSAYRTIFVEEVPLKDAAFAEHVAALGGGGADHEVHADGTYQVRMFHARFVLLELVYRMCVIGRVSYTFFPREQQFGVRSLVLVLFLFFRLWYQLLGLLRR